MLPGTLSRRLDSWVTGIDSVRRSEVSLILADDEAHKQEADGCWRVCRPSCQNDGMESLMCEKTEGREEPGRAPREGEKPVVWMLRVG